MQVRGRGEGPVATEEALDGAIVGDTHPMAPRALLFSVPLSTRHLGVLVQACGLAPPPRRTGRGPES